MAIGTATAIEDVSLLLAISISFLCRPVDQASILLPGAHIHFSNITFFQYIMASRMLTLVLAAASFIDALPVAEKRAVTTLDQVAFEEAQRRDDTATRAFSSVPIKVRRVSLDTKNAS